MKAIHLALGYYGSPKIVLDLKPAMTYIYHTAFNEFNLFSNTLRYYKGDEKTS